jgi:hypothetical protein
MTSGLTPFGVRCRRGGKTAAVASIGRDRENLKTEFAMEQAVERAA